MMEEAEVLVNCVCHQPSPAAEPMEAVCVHVCFFTSKMLMMT